MPDWDDVFGDAEGLWGYGTPAPYPGGIGSTGMRASSEPLEAPPPARGTEHGPARVAAQMFAHNLGIALSNRYIVQRLVYILDLAKRGTIAPITGPPWGDIPPLRHTPVHQAASLSSLNNDIWTTVTNVQMAVPRGRMGVIKAFAQDLGDPANWGTVNWRFAIDGDAVAGYRSFTFQFGQIEAPAKTTIIVPEGTTLTMQVHQSSGSALTDTITGMIYGWTWPMPKRGTSAHDQAGVA